MVELKIIHFRSALLAFPRLTIVAERAAVKKHIPQSELAFLTDSSLSKDATVSCQSVVGSLSFSLMDLLSVSSEVCYTWKIFGPHKRVNFISK